LINWERPDFPAFIYLLGPYSSQNDQRLRSYCEGLLNWLQEAELQCSSVARAHV